MRQRPTLLAAATCAVLSLLGSQPPLLAQELATLPSPGADAPRLDWFAPIHCVELPDGRRYRLQCSEGAEHEGADPSPVCLAALDAPDSHSETLRRTRSCVDYLYAEDLESFRSVGYQFVPAIAEAPPGWLRDEQGRVMQVSFDLYNRFYLGAGWLPSINHREQVELGPGEVPNASPLESEIEGLGRVRFDMGLEASVYEPNERSRYTYKALEGSVAMSGLELEGLLFGYDYSHDYRTPLLRITSFFGRPRRHDVGIDLGWGISLLDVRARPGWRTPATWLDIGEVHGAWDIWQTKDLYNHIRLELGGGIGALWQDNVEGAVLYGATTARVEGRLGLDRDGLHYLFAELLGTVHNFTSNGFSGERTVSIRSAAAYEVIFLAINDQPLSLRLEAATERAEGLRGLDVWSTTFTTALRFSFWAPAQTRHLTPQQHDAL